MRFCVKLYLCSSFVEWKTKKSPLQQDQYGDENYDQIPGKFVFLIPTNYTCT